MCVKRVLLNIRALSNGWTRVPRLQTRVVMQRSSSCVSAKEQMLAGDRGINRCRVMLVYGTSHLCPFGSSAAERMQPADLSRLWCSPLWLGLEAWPVNCRVSLCGTNIKKIIFQRAIASYECIPFLFFNVTLSLPIKVTMQWLEYDLWAMSTDPVYPFCGIKYI